MFDDDIEKLLKQVERERRAMLIMVCYLLFLLATLVVALTFIGCASPDMTDREAAAVVELLKD